MPTVQDMWIDYLRRCECGMLDTHDYRREIKESFSWSSKASYPVQAGISNTSKVQVQVQLSRPRWDFKYIRRGDLHSQIREPEFGNVDKGCWTSDNCPRRGIRKKAERIRSCSAYFSVGHATVAFLWKGMEKTAKCRHLHPDTIVVVHAPQHLPKIIRVDLIWDPREVLDTVRWSPGIWFYRIWLEIFWQIVQQVKNIARMVH